MTKGYKIITRAPGIMKEKLLFSKYHNTRNRGCLLKLVGFKFQKDKELFFMKWILSIWYLLPREAVKANSSSRFRKRLDKAFKNTSRADARENRQLCAV